MVRSSGDDQRVHLLASVVLLLDDEAEQVGAQVLQLNHALDSLVQSRMNFLRIRTGPDGSLQAAVVSNERREVVPGAVKMRLDVNMAAYQVVAEAPSSYFAAPSGDPNATQAIAPTTTLPVASGLHYDSFQAFDVALRNALQQAMRSTGVEPLAERGYTLIPNEVAIYLVGRADASTLAATAIMTQTISASISTHIDARRFALLIAAPPSDTPLPSIPLAGNAGAGWQGQAMSQPWRELLSWQQGEPPLLYAFMYESWDEAGRFHKRPELHYAIAESLLALFVTGILEQPQFREALDFSAAAFDSADGLGRLGSIGTSIITAPTQGMIDYLAYRLAADVLLRHGLLGNTTGMPVQTTTHRTITAEAQDEAEKWLKTALRGRLLPQSYPLPRALPPHELEDGKQSQWFTLALSTASPDPAPLVWRWVTQQRLYLNDERFWNVVAQNEFETAQDAQNWNDNLTLAMAARRDEITQDLRNTIHWRMLGAQGTERAKAFARELTGLLIKEEGLLEEAVQQQRIDVERHQRLYENYLRQVHQQHGVPQRTKPPVTLKIPQLPRNMEALAHEVIDQSFNRAPLPGTIIVVGLLMALIGAFISGPVGRIALLPNTIATLLTGQYGAVVGAATLVIIFALALIGPIVNIVTLRRRQQRYAAERALLWLTHAKEVERAQMEAVVHDILLEAQQANAVIEQQVRTLEFTVQQLNQEAQHLRDHVATAALSRDIFISRGLIWEGANPDELYLQIRERLQEPQLIEEFLRYVDAHASEVIAMIGQDTLGIFAVDFLRAKLRATPNESPFALWDAATAAQALDRANQAARIPMQPQLAGRALGHVQALSLNPTIAWISRVAQDRGYITIATTTEQTIVVVRVVSRAHHNLVR